jgi:hypothetical protein
LVLARSLWLIDNPLNRLLTVLLARRPSMNGWRTDDDRRYDDRRMDNYPRWATDFHWWWQDDVSWLAIVVVGVNRGIDWSLDINWSVDCYRVIHGRNIATVTTITFVTKLWVIMPNGRLIL